MEEEIKTGALLDTRSSEERLLDYSHEEFIGGLIPSIVWTEKTEWTHLSIRNQITSSSCGPQSLAKCLEYFTTYIESATPSYKFRANFPSEGMSINDIGSVGKKGTTTEEICPSQNMTEDQMNTAVIPSELPHGISSYYTLPLDMGTIAAALSRSDCVIFLITSTNHEYIDVPYNSGQPTTFAHFVACVPSNYTLHKGEMAFIIDDSCAPGSTLKDSSGKPTGQRIFTESFLKARCKAVMGIVANRGGFISIPHCSVSQDLSFGMMNSYQVSNLQDMLKASQVLDWNIPSTGNFLAATKSAVIKFQQKYAADILTPQGLTEGTGYVGPLTIAKLRSLFP